MTTLRPGITLQHTREVQRSNEMVRSDIAGIIGIIRKGRWPNGARSGDFVEIPLTHYQELVDSPMKDVFDPVSLRAVHKFFENGGAKCHLFGLCIKSPMQLISPDPYRTLFFALLDRLRGEEDLGLILMPVLAHLPIKIDMSSGEVRVAAQPTMELLLEHCREMNNRFLILDAPKDLHEHHLANWVRAFRNKNAVSASYGAVYYPWLQNGDEVFPPSGAVAGLFARTEIEAAPFGVRNPPANEIVRGVTHPSVPLLWRECDQYINDHINLILTQPSRGVVVWGARTLSSQANWRHINTRRVVSLIIEQLRRDSEWVVFENQRPELWDIVVRTASSRLDMLYAAGLLEGDNANSSYLVRCDRELNPPEVRNAGQVHVNVRLRPISTAEYIVVDLRLGE